MNVDAFSRTMFDAEGWLVLLWTSTLKGSVLLIAAAIATAALRRASAALRHLIWCVALAGAVSMPLFSQILPAWRTQWMPDWKERLTESPAREIEQPSALEDRDPHRRPIAANALAAAPATTPQSPAVETAQHPRDPVQPAAVAKSVPSRPFEWRRWLGVFWLAGSGLAFVPFLAGLIRVIGLTRNARLVADPAWIKLLHESARELGVRRPVQLLRSASIHMPFTWGARRPVILFPSSIDAWAPERCRMVILHELAHIKRCDWITQVLTYTACAVYWFNPLVWLAARQMRVECEQACDDLVLAGGSKPSDYASELFTIAGGVRTAGLLDSVAMPMARPSALESRVVAILDGKRNREVLTRTRILTAIGVLAAIGLPVAMLRSSGVENDPPPAYEKGVVKSKFDLSVAVGHLKFQPRIIARRDASGAIQVENGLGVAVDAEVVWPAMPPTPASQLQLTLGGAGYDIVEIRLFDHATRELLHDSDWEKGKVDPSKFKAERQGNRDSLLLTSNAGQWPERLDVWLRIIERSELPHQKNAWVVRLDAPGTKDGSTLRVADAYPGTRGYRLHQQNGQIEWLSKATDDTAAKCTVVFVQSGARVKQRQYVVAVDKRGQRHVPDYPHFVDFEMNGRTHIQYFDVPLAAVDHFEWIPFGDRHKFYFAGVWAPRTPDDAANHAAAPAWPDWLKVQTWSWAEKNATPPTKTWNELLAEARRIDRSDTEASQMEYLRELQRALDAKPPRPGDLDIRLAIGDAMVLNFSHKMRSEAIPWYAQTIDRCKDLAPSTGTMLAKVRLAELLVEHQDREIYRPLFTQLLNEVLDAPEAAILVVDNSRFLTLEEARTAKYSAAERKRMADAGAPPDNLDQLDAQYGQRLVKERADRIAELHVAAAVTLARGQWNADDLARTRANLLLLQKSRVTDKVFQDAVAESLKNVEISIQHETRKANGKQAAAADALPVVMQRSAAVAASPQASPTAVVAQSSVDEDSLQGIKVTLHATYLPLFDRNRQMFKTLIFLAFTPSIDTTYPNLAEHGIDVNAAPHEVAAKADQGDLYHAAPNVLATLRGARIAPLRLARIDPESPNWTMIDRLQRMTRSEIVAQVESFQKQHAVEEVRRATVGEGEVYVVVRADHEAFVLKVGELSQNPDGSNQQLLVAAVPIGKLSATLSNAAAMLETADDDPRPALRRRVVDLSQTSFGGPWHSERFQSHRDFLERAGDLKNVDLSGSLITDDDLGRIATSPTLRHLGLESTRIGDAGCIHLRRLGKLESLGLSDSLITDRGLESIQELRLLTTLFLRNTRISSRGMDSLERLSNLENLDLALTPIDDRGLRHLAGMNRLTYLNLTGAPINGSGFEHWVGLKALRQLYLTGTLVNDDGLTHLRSLPALEVLWLNGTAITDAGLAQVAQVRGLKQLQLQRTAITDAGVEHLLGLERMTDLTFDENPISDGALTTLGKMRQLERLTLFDVSITDHGLSALVDLPSLNTLVLTKTSVTDDGLRHLEKLRSLRDIYLSRTRVTETGIKRLQAALPAVKLTWEPVP